MEPGRGKKTPLTAQFQVNHYGRKLANLRATQREVRQEVELLKDNISSHPQWIMGRDAWYRAGCIDGRMALLSKQQAKLREKEGIAVLKFLWWFMIVLVGKALPLKIMLLIIDYLY